MRRRWKATSRSCFDILQVRGRKAASCRIPVCRERAPKPPRAAVETLFPISANRPARCQKHFTTSILHTQNGFLQTFGVSGPQGPGTSILQTVALLLQIPIPQHKKTAGRCFTPRCLWRKVRDSNPRRLSPLQFSRLTPSTTLPTFRLYTAAIGSRNCLSHCIKKRGACQPIFKRAAM